MKTKTKVNNFNFDNRSC